MTTITTGGGSGSDIDRFAAAIEQKYKDAHNLKKNIDAFYINLT